MKKKNIPNLRIIDKGHPGLQIEEIANGIFETKKLRIKLPDHKQIQKKIKKRKYKKIRESLQKKPKKINEDKIDYLSYSVNEGIKRENDYNDLNKVTKYNTVEGENKKKLNILEYFTMNVNKTNNVNGIKVDNCGGNDVLDMSCDRMLLEKKKPEIEIKNGLKSDLNFKKKKNFEINKEEGKRLIKATERPNNHFYGLISNSDLKKYGNLYEKGFLKKKRKKRFKLKYFHETCNILSEIFIGKEVNLDNFKLDLKNQEIIFFLLKKKYEVYFKKMEKKLYENNDISIEKKLKILLRYILSSKDIISKKRKEENMKFIFKTTLKKMKIKFFQIKNLDINRINDTEFYLYYFKMKKKNDFFQKIYSINKKTKKKTEFINKKALALYFSSKKFEEDFFFYLINHFKELYMKGVNKKWQVFFKKYETQYKNFDKCYMKIIEYIESEVRLKFPWTSFEIDFAIQNFYTIMKEIKK